MHMCVCVDRWVGGCGCVCGGGSTHATVRADSLAARRYHLSDVVIYADAVLDEIVDIGDPEDVNPA